MVMVICWYNYLLLCIILVISLDVGLYFYRDCLWYLVRSWYCFDQFIVMGIFWLMVGFVSYYRYDVDLCWCVGY